MPELKNVFHAGKMNKDLDERLIPNGQYRDALNVDVSFSESSDAGSAQNSYGNVVKSTVGIGGTCIGSVVDKQTENILWFICGDTVDAIAEYNPFTGDVTPVLVDTNKGTSSSFLNFNSDFLITGANIIDELLFFTDNNSEPKKINISRMKNGSTNFSTTTKYQNSDGTYTNNVHEALITVIKKYPLNAPKVKLDSSIREGNVKGVSYSSSNSYFVERSAITSSEYQNSNFLPQNILASTSGSHTIFNLTEENYLERVANNYVDDNNNLIISFATSGFTTGVDYKKWRAVEPGMKVAISTNGSGTWAEPVVYHTVETVDWYNHTLTVKGVAPFITQPTDGTKIRIFHWSSPYNNDYFWAYKNSSGNILKKPVGTNSENFTDASGNILKDAGLLGDGTGTDITLTQSAATSGTGEHNYETGWSYSSGTYSYDGTGGSVSIYPKITAPTDLIKGHIYRMKATITITTAGTIGFLNEHSNINGQKTGINGYETRRSAVGTHEIDIIWKCNNSSTYGQLCIFAESTAVGTLKINEIVCLSKPRVVRVQPLHFYGNTSYAVNDIITLQANDVLATSSDDNEFVDITVKLTKEIKSQNNKRISNSHADAIGTGVTGNQKISNGDFSNLTTWHTGTSGTTDIGTSSAGFYVTGGTLTSSNSAGGYVRNVLSEALVADEVYKLTYTVTTASSGSSGLQGRLNLILATDDRYTGDDTDRGHSNHILLPTHATGTYSVYWKQKSIERGAFSLTELMFFNDTEWSGAIDNVGVQKVSGNSETSCGFRGSNNNGRQAFDIEILSIDNSIIGNLGNLKFVSRRQQPEAIYEKEFARFAYRYKYIDNEYSAISPFTEVCFIPKDEDGYNYDSKQGYNKSMINDLRRITLSGISKMPEDVKSIDILYKKSDSTNVYIVRTIQNKDFETLKTDDSVVITSEEIKSLLSENQMLRPYDNVPRKAKAQEITGNRIMYGNYLQQYNYFNTPAEFKVKTNSIEVEDKPLKSLKALRNYQIGVSFLDKYGRQTPVFTDETGIVKLDQNKAATANMLQCALSSSPPDWATHYKYYVKDSSSEYYNLAMDRFYSDVEDENVWISFPSSEINKINENDYISIKKQHDSETAVSIVPGSIVKYKVLDKQAQPPEHIRFRMEEIGESENSVTFSAGAVVNSSDNNATKNAKYEKQFCDYPVAGKSSFSLSAYDIRKDAELIDELESYITNTGVWYDVDNRFVDFSSTLNGSMSKKYEIEKIYKKTITIAVEGTTNAHYQKGIAQSHAGIVVVTAADYQNKSVIALDQNQKTSESNDQVVSDPDGALQVGMRLVDSKDVTTYTGSPRNATTSTEEGFKVDEIIVITKVGTNSITLSSPISVSEHEELTFMDMTDVYLFKTKTPFSHDISFMGNSPQAEKIELLDIATSSYDSSNTVLPNPQDLKLKVKFFKQTTEDHGEEFKGKFFIKTARDHILNDFIYQTQAANKTFKSRDSAKMFYAQTWLLDQGNGDAIIEDTNLTTSSNYIKELLGLSTTRKVRYETFFNESDLVYARRAFGINNWSASTRLISGEKNGNGFNLNPETAGGVAWAATITVGGVAKHIKFGGTTRGIIDSSVYGQNAINGFSMKELDYANPSNSGGAANPSICIDQTVGFRVMKEPGNPKTGDLPQYDVAPYVGDGWQVGKTNCTFKLFGINGFGRAKGNLGVLYNFYRYLTTEGQTFRFTNDPTNTAYIIRGFEAFDVVNTDCRTNDGSITVDASSNDQTTIKPDQLKYYEKSLAINIQLDKAIVWSPMESVGSNGQPVITPLELNTNSYAANKTFGSTEEKNNKENLKNSNSSRFSAFEIDFGEVDISSDSPAVFEVLPKDKADLELFYETPVARMVVKDGMSVKTNFRTANNENPLSNNAIVTKQNLSQGNVFQIKPSHVNFRIPAGEEIIIFEKDQNGNVLYEENFVLNTDIVPVPQGETIQSSGFEQVDNVVYNILNEDVLTKRLEYYNCFAFGNGVESNRLFDDYNAVTIDKGPRVSTILNEDYKEETKYNSIIYSGIYNSKSSFNNLNQFIQGEKITKDLNPDYGSIQKLHTRDTNIVVLCEDKVLKVLATKDAIFNADGNPQLTATNKVLGQAVPFAGEYGISTNPESFASYGYRCYFSDKKRGAVLRLSMDGLTNISEKGMSKYFRENLDDSLKVHGSYDVLKDNYNITLNGKTLSFTEKVNGWVSFKSFVPENGLSITNSYYTFKDGEIYMHGENLTRNNFYGTQYDSTVNLIFNGEPDTVKDFKTISYEGDTGWIANTITTDKESGSITAFVEKEGKYFNFIKGTKINNDVDLLKTAGLNVQGIGKPSTIGLNSNVRSFTHTVTAVDIASNKHPKKWIINNSSSDSTSTNKVIKFNEKSGSNVTGKTVDFYIHPQVEKGILWKLAADDFTFSLTEPTPINNFAGTVAATLQGNGSIRVRITYVSNPFPSSNTVTTLTITAGSAYQEQI
tara:strand:- start:3264 stop:10631 length:7368 start_codon:yes stop_codon:yes gene_type:complete